jgi:hypothetical protein
MNYFQLKEKITIFEQIKNKHSCIDPKIYEKYSIIEFNPSIYILGLLTEPNSEYRL